jgi:hypothetical protein
MRFRENYSSVIALIGCKQKQSDAILSTESGATLVIDCYFDGFTCDMSAISSESGANTYKRLTFLHLIHLNRMQSMPKRFKYLILVHAWIGCKHNQPTCILYWLSSEHNHNRVVWLSLNRVQTQSAYFLTFNRFRICEHNRSWILLLHRKLFYLHWSTHLLIIESFIANTLDTLGLSSSLVIFLESKAFTLDTLESLTIDCHHRSW